MVLLKKLKYHINDDNKLYVMFRDMCYGDTITVKKFDGSYYWLNVDSKLNKGSSTSLSLMLLCSSKAGSSVPTLYTHRKELYIQPYSFDSNYYKVLLTWIKEYEINMGLPDSNHFFGIEVTLL